MVMLQMTRRVIAALLFFLCSFSVANATNHFTRINEVFAGLNGDSSVQFVEIVAQGHGQKLWGPQLGEPVGRAMLVFFDEKGNRVGRFVVPSNPDTSLTSSTTVLFATQQFVSVTGITPDFIIPPLVSPNAGKVCFMNNPDNSGAFFVDMCLAYGGTSFTGTTAADEGPANASTLAILNSQSLTRINFDTFGSFGDSSQRNGDFALRTPTPASTKATSTGATVANLEANLAGQVEMPLAQPLMLQGRVLFTSETFRGNGRTCATCHVERDRFALTPLHVSTLPPTDPLFIHQRNINTLVLNSQGSIRPTSLNGTQPSDLRVGATITGSLGGSAVVLAGTGTTYLVVGGQDLNIPGNTISDANGNIGRLVSFAPGNLQGPSPFTGLNEPLENTSRLGGSRALITENIDGFSARAVMRGSPMLMNLAHTAPYGLSGEIPTLQEFSRGAVVQHAPRRLDRVPGTDFRDPTAQELDAMAEFQKTITAVADGDFDEARQFDRFATTAAQKRGRDLFFGAAKCSVCHSGKALNLSDGRFGTQAGVNQNFNTGVVLLPVNQTDGLPTEEKIGSPPNSREFNTPSVMGIRGTGPFFHDGSVPDLLQAVQFYDTPQFRNSPAHALVGDIDAVSIPQNANDIVAFLAGLGDLPFAFATNIEFGEANIGASNLQTLVLENIGSTSWQILSANMTGPGSSDFLHGAVLPNTGPIAPGETRTIDITFAPTIGGLREAILEIQIAHPGEIVDFGISMHGTGASTQLPEIDVTPTALNLGAVLVDGGASSPLTITITNLATATGPLNISGVSLIGPNAPDFAISADSASASLSPGASRTVQIVFDPLAAGLRVAALRIQSNDSNESIVDIPLAGTGAAPEITVTPSSVSFGSIDVAQGPSVAAAITIRNDGQVALALTSVVLQGADAADFLITADSGQTSLDPGASRSISVAFDPQTPGAKSATLRMLSNDPDEAQTDVALSGTGNSPEIVVTPLSLSFGNQRVSAGQTPSQAVTIQNVGSTALSLTTVALQGPGATEFVLVSGGGPGTLNPGASRTVFVAFDPTAPASQTAVLRITSNDADESSLAVNLTGTGTDPEIDVTPVTLSFGAQDISAGPALAQSVLIRNLGNVNLTLSAVLLSGTNPSDFAIVSDSGQTLVAPGGARQLQIAFDPASLGTKVAQILILSDDNNEPSSVVTLLGIGAAPEITVIPGAINFGNRDVAAGPSTPATLVSIRNDGNANLSVSGVSLTGANAGDFLIVADTGQTVLGAGATRVLQLVFDPSAVGARSAALTILSTDADEATTNIFLSGNGTAPEIDVTPLSIGFGEQGLSAGQTAAQNIVITNIGSTPLAISSIALQGANPADFKITPAALNTTLGAGGIATIQVTFDPAAIGPRSAVMTITSSDFNEGTVGVALSGTGVEPDIDVSPLSNDFGSRAIAAGASSPQQFTIANAGNGSLNISSITLAGSVPGQFEVTSDTGQASLAAGQSRTVGVAFNPSATGFASAVLRIISNDVNESQFDVVLIGTGTAPAVSIAPSSLSLDFGSRDIRAGASATKQVTVANSGTSNLDILGVAVGGANPADFAVVSDSGESSLPPGTSRTITVAFDPSATQSRSAQLRITSNDTEFGTIDVQLTGVGTNPEIDISPLAINFGAQPIAAGATAQQSIVISNNGTTPLTFQLSFLPGTTSPTEFGLAPNMPGALTVLQPGGSLAIGVAFDPNQIGARTLQILVASDDLDEASLTVNLSGTGTDPEVSISPANLGFGTADVAAGPTLTQAVTIRNDGTADLAVSRVALEGANATEFMISADSAQSIVAPGSARSVVLRFDPSTAGSKSASLSIVTNDSDESTVVVPLIGTAIHPEISLSSTSISFGTQNLGAGAGSTKTLEISNIGTTALVISSLKLVGSDAGQFAIVSDSGETSLPGSATRTLAISFEPARSGAHTASIVVSSSDFDEVISSVDLAGAGNAAPSIVGQKPVVIAVAQSRGIVATDLVVSDTDNTGPFTVAVQSGANYTLNGATVTPVGSFTGTLTVPVTVNDGRATSAVFNLQITVTNDRDGDGVADAIDAFPDNPTEQVDTDKDGIGNNADTDDDNDGLPDSFESTFGSDPLVKDTDADGLDDQQEALRGTDPRSPDTDNDGVVDGLDTLPLADNVPPTITPPADITVDSTGVLTSVAIGVALANDIHDGSVVAVANVSGPFRPGHHVVTWTAKDAAGNTASAVQVVDVRPMAYIELDQWAVEGSHVSVRILLNGDAITYPVTVPYTVSGTATPGADHSLVSGAATIAAASGNMTTIEFDVAADGTVDNGETVVIALGAPTGAVLGAVSLFTATIIDESEIPEVRFEIEQMGQLGAVAPLVAGGTVNVSAKLSTPPGVGTWAFDWSRSDSRILSAAKIDGANLAVNPGLLSPGSYRVSVVVKPANPALEFSREAQIFLRAVRFHEILSGTKDSDGDSIPDAAEGEGDADGDAVPDYLDSISRKNVLQLSPGASTPVMVAESLAALQLGDVAFGVGAARVNSTQIVAHFAEAGADVKLLVDSFANVGGYFDFKILPPLTPLSGLTPQSDGISLVFPLTQAIPPDAVLRQFDLNSGWSDFAAGEKQQVFSAVQVDGACPEPASTVYVAGLIAGNDCVRIAMDTTSEKALLVGVAQGRPKDVVTPEAQQSNSKKKKGGAIGLEGLLLLMLLLLAQRAARWRTDVR